MKSSFVDFLKEIVKKYPELKIAIGYQDWETDFLRFCNSEVNYNISKNSHALGVQLYKGKRNYSFQLNNPTETEVIQSLESALEIIGKLPEDPDFVDLENNLENKIEKEKENNIEKVPLEKKVEILHQISEAVKPFDYKIFGTFICNYQTLYLINSNGIDKKMTNSPIMLELKAVSNKNEVTVIESYGSENIESFDLTGFIERLLEKVKNTGKEIVDVEPDYYEVILSPRCIGQLISYLAYAGMTAGSYDKKRSYFEGKVGEKLFPETITLTDDPEFPGLINIDYNSDGHIYKKTVLIEKGVFKTFLVNNYYSYKTGLEKNGAEGECLVLETGSSTLQDMIKGINKGLFISNLHYMNFINVKETSITGLTRDGTFLIENGELNNVVNNLRFTVKIVDVINAITEIENIHHLVPSSDNYGTFSISSSAMPHVKVKAFKITSSTKTI